MLFKVGAAGGETVLVGRARAAGTSSGSSVRWFQVYLEPGLYSTEGDRP